jgi:MYXO-CTERM domain-containing protein
MNSLTSFHRLFSSVALSGLMLLTSGSVLARPEIPGQIQAVADMQCVPLCTLCHATNPGEKTNWSKPLGAALYAPINMQEDITTAYKAWAAANPAKAADLKLGKEPGSGLDICGPTYGCAVHVAKEAAAPRDFTGPLWAVGAMVTAGLLRRRRKSSVR